MDSTNTLSRRRFLRSTGAAGAISVGLGSGIAGSTAGAIEEFDELSVSCDNRIVNENGETFVMRGLNIPDPKRLEITKHIRGKNSRHLINLITNTQNGWHPRVIRVPVQPSDIGEHPNGNTGEKYGPDSPKEIANDRQKMIPPQPVEQDDGNVAAFSQDQLNSYVEKYLDPVVEQCKQRGVYCIVDFHRHWHEQPPGDGEGNGGPEGDAEAENHLPYNSENTLYWARNTYYGDDGKDVPASWGYVDQRYRNEISGLLSGMSDIKNGDTPYDKWEVNQDLVDEAIMFWDTVAERYADEPHVIYEPYNEPTAPGIWGPVEGCGAFKQKPLWDVYVDDFATPIMDAIREHAPEKLLLMSVPGWCQSTQALHWRDFEHENVAITWHNYAGHSVSKEENWLNDTDYGDGPCKGWEPEESQGLQNVMDVRPVVVTEFGWDFREEQAQKQVEIDKWLTTGRRSREPGTDEYGKPFIDAMESDDRISWVAWCADTRWVTRMFSRDFPVAESVDLTNGSWYETPKSEYPVNCEELPCDWKLRGNPAMGEYIKQMLAEKKEDKVPFDAPKVAAGNTAASKQATATSTPETSTPGAENTTSTPETSTSAPETATPDSGCDGPTWPENATDPDGDDRYEDLNGNGRVDSDDVVRAFENEDSEEMQANSKFYDFNDNGRFDFDDVVKLFKEL